MNILQGVLGFHDFCESLIYFLLNRVVELSDESEAEGKEFGFALFEAMDVLLDVSLVKRSVVFHIDAVLL